MDPTLTREKAHKVFGDLYRKQRPPELQKVVDEIVSSNSDIFIRIQRIEELDEKEKRKNAPELPGKEIKKGAYTGGGGRSAGGSGGFTGKKSSALPGVESHKKPGILKKILGGDIARWGSETGTLDSGWFGMNLKLSKGSLRIFLAFKEEEIVSIIKAFRLAISYGWEDWDPEKYNTVIATYHFFNEFVKIPSLLKSVQKPDDYVISTIKLQRAYAALLMYASYEKILSEDLLAFVEKNQSKPDLFNNTEKFVKFIKRIENKAPTLQNVIRAFYALGSNNLRSWEEIVNEIRVPPPVLDTFNAPASVSEKIMNRVKKIKEDIRNKTAEAAEIEEIRKKYFTFEGNKVQTAFLNPICEQIMSRIFQKNILNDSFIKNQKSQPHRLLYLLLKDMDLVVGPFLCNPINTKSQGGADSVAVFRPGMFKAFFDEIDAIIREIELFSKNNASLVYSFKDFYNDVGGTADPVLTNLFSIIKRANKVFTGMVLNIKCVIENHRMALKADAGKGAQEKLSRTKSLPIESFEIGMRYLPFADNSVITHDRFNDKKVLEVVNELAKNLYNYLYIFKDENTIRTLASVAHLKTAITAMEAELKRMGVTAE